MPINRLIGSTYEFEFAACDRRRSQGGKANHAYSAKLHNEGSLTGHILARLVNEEVRRGRVGHNQSRRILLQSHYSETTVLNICVPRSE